MASFKYWCWRPLLSNLFKCKLNIYFNLPSRSSPSKFTTKSSFRKPHYLSLLLKVKNWIAIKFHGSLIAPSTFLHHFVWVSHLQSSLVKDSGLSQTLFLLPQKLLRHHLSSKNQKVLSTSFFQTGADLGCMDVNLIHFGGGRGLFKKSEYKITYRFLSFLVGRIWEGSLHIKGQALLASR